MKAFSEQGVFCLSSNPSDDLPGVLNYDPVSGITLDLMGSFDLPPGRSRRIDRILGILKTHKKAYKSVLLEDCSRSSSRFGYHAEGFTYDDTSYTVKAIYFGVYFDSNGEGGLSGDLLFDKMYVEFPLLLQWVGVSGLRCEQDEDEPSKIAARFEQPNEIKASTDSTEAEDEVGFYFGWKLFRGIIEETSDEIKINQTTYFFYTAQTSRDWAYLSRYVTAIARLLSIVFNKKVSPSCVRLRQAGEWEYERQFEIFFCPDEYAEEIEAPEEINRIYRNFSALGQMRMSYAELGGMSFVTKWLDIADKYYVVLSKLMSCKFGSMPYLEDKFHQARSAIEAYWVLSERGGQGKQFRPADKLLVDLVKEAGFSDVLGEDPGSWASSVEANRNGYSSHFQLEKMRAMRDTNMKKMVQQTYCLYYLTVVLLLKDAGVEDSVLGRVRGYVKSRLFTIRDSLGL